MASVKVLREEAERQFADMIDNSLLYLTSSDQKLPPMDVIHSSDMAVESIKDRRLYVRPDDGWRAETILAGDSHLPGVRYVLFAGQIVEFAAMRRMKSLRSIPADVRSLMRIDRYDILRSGRVKRGAFTAHLLQDRWSVDHHCMSAGRRSRTFSAAGWQDYEVMADVPIDMVVMPIALIAAGILRQEHWMVTFSVGLPQKVSVPTDAIGVREWFRMRDVPEGRTRRQALLHWVSAHSRQSRVDPDVEYQVREHLRGARTFDWFDMTCTIKPTDEPVPVLV